MKERFGLQIRTRLDFGALFTRLGFRGHGVEVGVQRGEFSEILRESWSAGTMHLVDRWKHDPSYHDIANVDDVEQERYFQEVRSRFTDDSGCVIHREESLEAAARFPDGFFDWIYIDADHSFDGTRADLEAWFPKLRAGGILAGHDYLDGVIKEGIFGVRSAVNDFLRGRDIELFLTHEAAPLSRSWYCVKPGEVDRSNSGNPPAGRSGEIVFAGSPRPAGWEENVPGLHVPEDGGEGRTLDVCVVTYGLLGPIRNGGIATGVTVLCENLVRAGHRVTVLYAAWWPPDEKTYDHWVRVYHARGIRLVPLACKPEIPFYGSIHTVAAYEVFEWLKEHTFDLIHLIDYGGLGYYSLLAKHQGLAFAQTTFCLTAYSPTLYIREANGQFVDDLALLEIDHMERTSVALSDVVISPSRFMLRWMNDYGWSLPDSTYVQQNIPPEVLRNAGSENTVQRRPVRELVFFGRLQELKGLPLFCDAIDSLCDQGRNDFRVTFLGKHATVQGRGSKEYIADRACDWPMEWKVLDDYDQEAALRYLQRPGCLAVMASVLDNLPFTVMECQQAGIPFVASRVGGIPEMIHGDDCGAVTYDRTVSGLSAKLAEVLQDGMFVARPFSSAGERIRAWMGWHAHLSSVSAAAGGDGRQTTNPPLVSICIAHHERPQYLRQLLDSILAQDYGNFEVIVVDDGSTRAETLAALDVLESEFATRGWELRRQENRYAGAARNTAVRHACGEYILFIDDDDVAKPGKLSKHVRVAQKTGADIVTCGVELFDGVEAPGPGTRPSARWLPLGPAPSVGLYMNTFGGSQALFRRSVFEELGGFLEVRGVTFEDYELFARAVSRGYRLEIIPECLTWYRQTPGSVMRTTPKAANYRLSLRAYEGLVPPSVSRGLMLAQGLHIRQETLTGTLKAARERVDLLDMLLEGATALGSGDRGKGKDIVLDTVQRAARTNDVEIVRAVGVRGVHLLAAHGERDSAEVMLRLLETVAEKTRNETMAEGVKQVRRRIGDRRNISSGDRMPASTGRKGGNRSARAPAGSASSRGRQSREGGPLTVTYLVDNVGAVTGGNMTVLHQANALVRRGYGVNIVSHAQPPSWFPLEARVVTLPPNERLAPGVPPSDVVISTYFTNTRELDAVSAPVRVYFAQGDQFLFGDLPRGGAKKNRVLFRRLKRLSDTSYSARGYRFVANSRTLAGAVEQRFGRMADAVLPVCVDRTVFRPPESRPPGPPFRVLVVGPDSRGTELEDLTFKGMGDIRSAIEILGERRADFQVIRISNTDMEVFRGTSCEFHVMPGDRAKTALFGAAHILVYASHYDSCPRPPLEAMASGVAVVCTDTSGAREYCVHEENCLLVPPRSPRELASAVERIMDEKSFRERLIRGGIQTAGMFPQEREWDELEHLLLGWLADEGVTVRKPESSIRPGVEVKPATVQLPAKPGSDIERSRRLLEEDRPEDAVRLLTNAAALRPDDAPLRTSLAWLLVNLRLFEDAARLIEQTPDTIKADPEWLEIAGFCMEGMGDLENAEACVQKALELRPSSARAQTLAGILSVARGDPDSAGEILRRAAALDESYAPARAHLGSLLIALGAQDEGYTLLEQAFRLDPWNPDLLSTFLHVSEMRGSLERASAVLARVCEKTPRNGRLLRALASTLSGAGRLQDALTAAEKAALVTGLDDDLLAFMLQLRLAVGPRKAGADGATLSVSMIVRDEEKFLVQCLGSVSPFADDIVVVDTGSNDRTQEIAGAFGARVFTMLWNDDFAEARNASLDMCQADWVLSLDADEILSPGDFDRIRTILRSQARRAYVLTTRNYVEAADTQGWIRNTGSCSEEAGSGWVPSQKIRLFPRDPRIRWEGKIHESVEASVRASGIPLGKSDVPVHHYGKLDRIRTRRKGEIYRAAGLAKLGSKSDTLIALVELARQESELGHHPEALERWEQILAREPDHAEALAGVGSALAVLGRHGEAEEPLARSLIADPSRREAAVHLALTKLFLGDPASARNIAVRLEAEQADYPFASAALAAAFFCLGENQKGLEKLARMRAANVGYAGFFLDLATRLTRSGRSDFAVKILETLSEEEGPTPELAAVLVDSYREMALAGKDARSL